VRGRIELISRKAAIRFLLPRHYSGRIPAIVYAFGWFIEDQLVAVCTFGKPASNSLCEGVCGKEYSKNVYELNRLCRIEELQEPLSSFVGACLRRLRTEHLIIVSFSDTGMNHHGYIYQALNFLYTGLTKERTDKYTPGNKHSRHYEGVDQGTARKVRTAKHRYVYFATKNKYEKKEWASKLNYPILPYPKGENQNYVLGEYLETKVIGTPPEEPSKMQIGLFERS
jgi:hypothetical protein